MTYGTSSSSAGSGTATLSGNSIIVSLDTGEVVREWESATEPLSVAEGLLFFTEDQENMAWSCINLETFETIPTT